MKITPTADAYYKYLKSLDKPRLLSMAGRYYRVNSMNKTTPKMDLVYTILQAEHGNKWFEKDIRLPEYAKKFLKIKEQAMNLNKVKLAEIARQLFSGQIR